MSAAPVCTEAPGHKLTQEAVRMKIRETVADMAENLDLPSEALSGEVRITLTGRRRAAVEHHRGLLDYSDQAVAVRTGAGSVHLLGRDLVLLAMDAETVLISGTITAVEYD